jgi:hypothetical protein
MGRQNGCDGILRFNVLKNAGNVWLSTTQRHELRGLSDLHAQPNNSFNPTRLSLPVMNVY